MTSQIDKTPNIWKEKEAIMSTHNISPVKSIKRLKSPKKSQECKKSTNEMKIEDVFLNSEYFKHQSGNISSLSFCSGDNGENQWTVDSKFEIPFRRKTVKFASLQKSILHPKLPPLALKDRIVRRNSYTVTDQNFYVNYINLEAFETENYDTIKSDTAVLEKEKLSKHWQKKLKSQNCPIDNSEEKLLEGILTEKGKIDRDLISLITDQMFLAERELQITRTHLIETIGKLNERDLEILQLHEKIQNLQKLNKTEAAKGKNQPEIERFSKTTEDYQRLVKASEKLKKQVKDMEEFLNDYGLVWVGEKESRKPDFDRIIKSFQRLNAVAAQPKIIQTTTGAKFDLPREISVVLYSNGLLLRDTDFREYNQASTSLFLQDVEDGYFPSELQIEFPEGVPFEVTDKRNETYHANGKIPVFQGKGNRLGSTFEGKPSPIVYLEPLKQNRNYETISNLELSDTFPMKKLHKKKIRNSSSRRDKIRTPSQLFEVDEQINAENLEKEFENSQNHLRVKIRYGKEKTESFVLQFPKDEKMYGFKIALEKILCERHHDECFSDFESNNKPPNDFEVHIYGRNPFRLCEHLNEYPIECGLVNNCVLNVSEI